MFVQEKFCPICGKRIFHRNILGVGTWSGTSLAGKGMVCYPCYYSEQSIKRFNHYVKFDNITYKITIEIKAKYNSEHIKTKIMNKKDHCDWIISNDLSKMQKEKFLLYMKNKKVIKPFSKKILSSDYFLDELYKCIVQDLGVMCTFIGL